MKIHEYQGKEIFKKHNIATPNGIPAFTVEEALEAYKSLKFTDIFKIYLSYLDEILYLQHGKTSQQKTI